MTTHDPLPQPVGRPQGGAKYTDEPVRLILKDRMWKETER